MASISPYTKFAEIYDELMGQEEFYESYFHFVRGIIGSSRPAILDLGCGTGKLAKIFKDNGYDIEGLDSSAGMLKIARKRGIKVYHKSMADFGLRKEYGTILSIFDSLNYLKTEAELRSCFKSVHGHLTDSGLFVFDLNSSYKITNVARLFGKATQYIVGGTKIIWANSHLPDRWIAELQIFSGNRKYYEKHVERAFRLATVKMLLRQSGFELVDAVADFDSNKIKKNSLKWFFVCRKH